MIQPCGHTTPSLAPSCGEWSSPVATLHHHRPPAVESDPALWPHYTTTGPQLWRVIQPCGHTTPPQATSCGEWSSPVATPHHHRPPAVESDPALGPHRHWPPAVESDPALWPHRHWPPAVESDPALWPHYTTTGHQLWRVIQPCGHTTPPQATSCGEWSSPVATLHHHRPPAVESDPALWPHHTTTGHQLWRVIQPCGHTTPPQATSCGECPSPVATPPLAPALSLPLWIPGNSLPGDAAGRLSQGVVNPSPLSSADLCRHWFLICCLLRVFVLYLLWPPDTEDFVQTAVDESVELMEYCWWTPV